MSTFTATSTPVTSTTPRSSRSRRRIVIAAAAIGAVLAAGLVDYAVQPDPGQPTANLQNALTHAATVKADRLQAQLDASVSR